MMAADGLAKLIEECGELQQVCGKRLAYFTADEHPDGGPPLPQRLQEEIADVFAACAFVISVHGLDEAAVMERSEQKLELFFRWHEEVGNNKHGIDGDDDEA